MNQVVDDAFDAILNKQFEYEQFLAGVLVFFQKHPLLNQKNNPIIHSIKSRFKDPEHLADKLLWKRNDGIEVNRSNVFSIITDYIGVRILHLYQTQFIHINQAIKEKIDNGDWVFAEPPKAYTWDPESTLFYENLSIITEVRDTYYTSIHYIVKPNNDNLICCEIQVRTLFEEIWGEIDHVINYPRPTESLACREQLRVLAKLVSTGTRLADSIYRSYDDYITHIS